MTRKPHTESNRTATIPSRVLMLFRTDPGPEIRALSTGLVLARRDDDFEVRPPQLLQGVEPLETGIRGDRQGPVAAVVRDEHPVLLQSQRDRLCVLRKTADVHRCPEPGALAHRRRRFGIA